MELRLRSPSYSGDNSKFLKSEQIQLKRKISVERPPTNPFNPPQQQILKINNIPYDKQMGNYTNMPQTSKQLLDLPEDNSMRDRRAVSTEKQLISVPPK